MAMLLGFGFLTGLGMGPLLQMAIMMNPSIVPTALLVTSTVFACFSGASLMAPDGKYLYLAGLLSSGLSTLVWLGLINIFFRSQLLFQVVGTTALCTICHSSLLFSTWSGSHLDRSGGFLWLHHVRHPADYQEGQEWRQRLHCPLPGSLHWLRPSFPKGSHPSHAEGKRSSVIFWKIKTKTVLGGQGQQEETSLREGSSSQLIVINSTIFKNTILYFKITQLGPR